MKNSRWPRFLIGFVFILFSASSFGASFDDGFNPDMQAFAESLLERLEAETVNLEVGKIFLFDGEPVLIVDGSFLKNGRVSNFWYWHPIRKGKIGPRVHGYDNEGRFTKAPQSMKITFDLSDATTEQTVNRSLPRGSLPSPFDVYQNGKTAVLIIKNENSHGNRTFTQRLEPQYYTWYRPIGADGTLGELNFFEATEISQLSKVHNCKILLNGI